MNPLANCATLACIWEATAPKPGNVYRGADFEDVSYLDFLTSAVVLGNPIATAETCGVGLAVLNSIQAIHEAVGSNTYLGTVLLLAPLAAVPAEIPLALGIDAVLANLSIADTRNVYRAIRLAEAGGLGTADSADVHGNDPEISLVEAMRLAAERDLVARQYTSSFREVFWVAERIAAHGLPLGEAIVRAFLELLAEFPDSLIARKCGPTVSEQVSARAAKLLALAESGDESYAWEIGDFDFWLRADGHRRNPGTSADLIAAGLFVLLRENRLTWPVEFY